MAFVFFTWGFRLSCPVQSRSLLAEIMGGLNAEEIWLCKQSRTRRGLVSYTFLIWIRVDFPDF